MGMTFGFYTDPALTTPVDAALPFVQGTTPSPADRVLWFGSRRGDHLCRATAGGQIALAISGPAAGNVCLALAAASLAAATPGAALNIGSEVRGGVGSAIAVHVRVLDTTGTVGSRAFAVTTASLEEFPV